MPFRTILGALIVATAALAAGAPAATDVAKDRRSQVLDVSVSCPPTKAGSFCPNVFEQTIETAGVLEPLFNAARADGQYCIVGMVELSVDGGPWIRSIVNVAGGGGATGWPGTGRVASGRHTLRLRYARVPTYSDCPDFTHWAGTLRLTTSVPRVATLSLEFRERRDRTRDELAESANRLGVRKNELDRAIDQVRSRLVAAVNSQAAVNARAARVRNQWRDTRVALIRLWNAERRLPQEGVQGHREVAARIGGRIARLEGRIVGATRAGSATAAMSQQLMRERRTLADVEQGIVERGPAGTRDIRRRWLGLARDLRHLLFELHVANAAAEHARATALTELAAKIEERKRVDQQALDAALRLSVLDFDVREVRVTANGREVYRADGSTAQYEELKRISEDLELAKRAEQALKPEFDRVRHAFYAAQRETIAAEADLAARLNYLALARYGTDIAFAFIDVAAAYASTGPVGAVTELVKKGAETQLSRVTVAGGFEAGSIEAEINARYRAQLKDAFSAPQLMKTGMERLAKDALAKPVKDALNRGLATVLFGPVGHRLQSIPTDAAGQPLNASSLRALLKAPERIGHTDSQIDKLRKGGSSLRSIGLNMLKDVAKTTTKSAFDDYEREAWITFFENDMYSRARYSIYVVARDLYAKAEDTRIWLEQRRLDIMARGVDPNHGFVRRIAETFEPAAQLEIELRAATELGPEALTLSALIGGKRLQPVARRRDGDRVVLTYRVGAGELDSGSEGGLQLEIR